MKGRGGELKQQRANAPVLFLENGDISQLGLCQLLKRHGARIIRFFSYSIVPPVWPLRLALGDPANYQSGRYFTVTGATSVRLPGMLTPATSAVSDEETRRPPEERGQRRAINDVLQQGKTNEKRNL